MATLKLTPARRALLAQAATDPRGGFPARSAASALDALVELGYAESSCHHGHVAPWWPYTPIAGADREHRGCPHFLRITNAGRTAIQRQPRREGSTP